MSFDRTAVWLPSVLSKQSTEDAQSNVTDVDVMGLRLKASCSDTFRQTMRDLHPIVTQSSAPVSQEKLDGDKSYDEHEPSSSSPTSEEVTYESQVKMTPAGRRAWDRLRLYVDEEAVRRRNNEPTMNWRFVRQVITVLPHVQQARTELYRRYLEKPDEWLDGLINCPEYLRQRRQQQIAHSQQLVTVSNHMPCNRSCVHTLNAVTKGKRVTQCHQLENRSKRVQTTGIYQLSVSGKKLVS